MEVKWDEKYSVGNQSIDAGHKEFFNIFNRWADDLMTGHEENVIKNALDELIHLARTHFMEEESLMISKGYEDYEKHSKEHKGFFDKILRLSNDHASGDDMVGANIASFMGDWIENHIKGVDMEAIEIFKLEPPQ